MEEITFKKLSFELKILVIYGWISLIISSIYFIVGFIMGLGL